MNCKNKRADALRARWTMIGIAKKSAKIIERMDQRTAFNNVITQQNTLL